KPTAPPHTFTLSLHDALPISIQMRPLASAADCSYLQNPPAFSYSPQQHWREVSARTETVSETIRAILPRDQKVRREAVPMPRKNFIDEYIFGRMERDGIQPAPISTDQEDLRR